ncbi:MAG: hypothetical protein AAF400_02555 [Bacteroidota bacterium]
MAEIVNPTKTALNKGVQRYRSTSLTLPQNGGAVYGLKAKTTTEVGDFASYL